MSPNMLGYRIKQLRSDAHLTQTELANIVGLTTSSIGMYENGDRLPSYDILSKLADYFNVTTDYLLGRNQIDDEKKQQTDKIYEVDPDMLITMCKASDLPEEERRKIRDYSKYIIEKYIEERNKRDK